MLDHTRLLRVPSAIVIWSETNIWFGLVYQSWIVEDTAVEELRSKNFWQMLKNKNKIKYILDNGIQVHYMFIVYLRPAKSRPLSLMVCVLGRDGRVGLFSFCSYIVRQQPISLLLIKKKIISFVLKILKIHFPFFCPCFKWTIVL